MIHVQFNSDEIALLKMLLREYITKEHESNWDLGESLPKEEWQKSQDAISLAKDALEKIEWGKEGLL